MKQLLKSITPLRRAITRYRMKGGVNGQSDESVIIRRLATELKTSSFIEFGFHPAQFNCASLLNDHAGLLIDGDSRQVADARALLKGQLTIQQAFLTLDNMPEIGATFPNPGVLSVDVDGNDYWFLKALLPYKPTVICVEYNPSFLDHSVTVPYDPAFTRQAAHASGWYHGASLVALAKLCAEHGYGLEAVSDLGGNAFFTARGNLDPATAWKPSALRNQFSGTVAEQQWDVVKGMPFEAV